MLSDIEIIRVGVDDILEGLEQNGPEKPSYRTHVLKITPPFGGEHTAALDTIREEPSQLPDHSDEPAYIKPVCFVGYEVGEGPPDGTDIEPPTKDSAARIAQQKDFNTSVKDQTEHQYQILLDMWKGRVKNQLHEQVRLAHDPKIGKEVWVETHYIE